MSADEQIHYKQKNPFRDGTTHILFSPLDFISKLAALVLRLRYNLVRYHGDLAINSKLRQHLVYQCHFYNKQAAYLAR